MFSLGSSHRYFLYRDPVDMRKGFDGLSGLVRNFLDKDPASGEVYVFLNRGRNLLKLLHWEHGGFVVYYKRLEKGTFVPPVARPESQYIRWPELVMMVEGIEVEKSSQKPRHILPEKGRFY
ncbi:IS66 family insertion sequence element accessory protein TnpB [Echinicola soli]|uniref:IS66 family insertion sequence element accessory protein TnpB n=1 Tax=Echinicola soli TaxID=2591634 RepID=A0A514CKS8_9BACT|nr:IS66 family insertion sequence element accessory protein TnpB [Echinicola soli]QDH80441.1 IS66 family insertion sequence element accessory protein TnpB [Echinicola soli]